MARVIKPETDKKVAEILKVHDQLVENRLPFEPTWIEIGKYEHPMISNFGPDDKQQGKKRTNYILDSSPILAIRRASEGYQSYMFPRSAPWFKFGLVQDELMKQKAHAIWLGQVETSMYAEMARSDFYQEGGKVIDNGLTIGTSAVFIEDNKEKSCSEYLSLHPKEVYIARDRYGLVDTMFRRFLITGRVILDMFSDTIKSVLKKEEIEKLEKNPHTKYPVIHAVFPRKDRLADLIDAKNFPWASVHILEDEQKMLQESGYPEFPFAVWAARLNTDEDYGRSSGWDALPDVKRLQQVVKAKLQAIQLGARSPAFYPQEMEGDLDLSPGGRVPYRDFARKVIPIQSSTINLQHVEAVAQQIRDVINDHFDVPFFLMFSQREKLQKTATEVAEIAGERAALMGTTVGRIETDFLDVVLQLSIRNAARGGRLTPPPPSLRRIPGVELKIKYIGPLANLQRRYHGQQNMTTTLAQAWPIFDRWPESIAVVNGPAAARKILTDGGMAPEAINDPAEEKKKVAEIQQAQANQANAAMLESVGKAAPGLQQVLGAGGPGSPATP